ncbi:hypothetical protein OGATHE_000582 [Ogataea polymorpha]|uniref:t-SNARE coiled-coil homology domain-containing protein n=1 Tax=Ogataea polymorpha TaxID=460523 RepID=A0A9P8TFR6_9ASCO|nr:hypothetical protein OGATHE_000582 [Ogataea polymorpha]
MCALVSSPTLIGSPTMISKWSAGSGVAGVLIDGFTGLAPLLISKSGLSTAAIRFSFLDSTDSVWDSSVLPPRHSKLTAGNTFVQDSIKLNTMILQLGSFINEIQTDYLLSHSKKLSEADKDEIDTNFKVQLGILNKKLESLRTYAELLDKQLETSNPVEELGRNLLTMGEYGQTATIANNTVMEVRANILKSLGLRLTKISAHFVSISSRRMERKKELARSTLNASTYLQQASYEPLEQEVAEKAISSEYGELTAELGQQQLQQLSQENESLLLEMKNAQIESVSQIEQSMLEISSVINEINLQLHLQNDAISVLSSHQDDTVANLKMGNTQLVKANERAKRSHLNFFTGCRTFDAKVTTSPILMFSHDASFFSFSSTNSPSCASFCRSCLITDDPTLEAVIEIESTTAVSWLGEMLTVSPGWTIPELILPLITSSSFLLDSRISLITMTKGQVLSTT